MKIMIAIPPLVGDGVPLLGQNRQFQWFQDPTFIYPMVPASAATLLQHRGHQVVWNDSPAEGLSYPQFLALVEAEQPQLIAMETKTPVVKQHWRIVGDLKGRFPHTLTVLMGDHVTALPQESMEHSSVDYVLTGGDYDFQLLSLVNHLQEGASLEPGIWHREDGDVKNSGPFVQHRDLDSLPFIDRDLTKWYLYAYKNGNFKRLPGTYTMAGRDCWWGRCTFCSWTTIYPRFATRSPECLLDEIGLLIERYGIREIFDDTGVFPAGGWLHRFCQGMIQRGYHRRVTLGCNMRFGALSLDEYRLMREAGLRFVLFGLESANQKTLDRLNKGLSLEEMVQSCQDASRAGLDPHLTVMLGYPWEDEKDALETLRLSRYLLRKRYAKTLQATVVIPYPGTPLFEECVRNGWLRTTDWERYDMREPVMTTSMPPERVMALTRQFYQVAFDPEFIARELLSIRSWEDLKFIYRAARAVLGHLRDFASPRVKAR